jgi:putative SOS response-associated peptidase YedK
MHKIYLVVWLFCRYSKGEWLHTCTNVTGEPNEFVWEIHTRMPVILPRRLVFRRDRQRDPHSRPG